MRKFAAAALMAAALGSTLVATPASADIVCITFTDEWDVASVPTPYGPASVTAPGQVEVTRDCSEAVRSLLTDVISRLDLD